MSRHADLERDFEIVSRQRYMAVMRANGAPEREPYGLSDRGAVVAFCSDGVFYASTGGFMDAL